MGELTLTQVGSKVTGTYGEDSLTITGTASDNKLTGTFDNYGITFGFEFYMKEGNVAFEGWFGDDQTAKQGWDIWNGEK